MPVRPVRAKKRWPSSLPGKASTSAFRRSLSAAGICGLAMTRKPGSLAISVTTRRDLRMASGLARNSPMLIMASGASPLSNRVPRLSSLATWTTLKSWSWRRPWSASHLRPIRATSDCGLARASDLPRNCCTEACTDDSALAAEPTSSAGMSGSYEASGSHCESFCAIRPRLGAVTISWYSRLRVASAKALKLTAVTISTLRPSWRAKNSLRGWYWPRIRRALMLGSTPTLKAAGAGCCARAGAHHMAQSAANKTGTARRVWRIAASKGMNMGDFLAEL